VACAEEALPAVAALTGLQDLTLLHLRTGRRGFDPEDARPLAALTALTRLTMLPVAGGPAVEWPTQPVAGAGLAARGVTAWPSMVEYRGPRLGWLRCDA
jgi:hypothetical protein